MSLHQIFSLGVEPYAKKIITAKAAIAPRTAYVPVAAHFILVDTPGPTTANPRLMEYHHCRQPLFPWEPEAQCSVEDRAAG